MFSFTLPDEINLKFAYCRSVCILTGAGISVESGLPAFRGPGRGGYFQGLPPDYLSTHHAWQQHPKIVSAFYQQYRDLAHDARPGIAHQTLHGWELRRFYPPSRGTIITQNIDGLHQLMG